MPAPLAILGRWVAMSEPIRDTTRSDSRQMALICGLDGQGSSKS